MVVSSSNTNMSKLSFRARALDPSKPMPIYMAADLPDLPDYSAINRAVPQMPTGMQKEEECEHHLQRAICTGLIIPTPEVTRVPEYDGFYPSTYKQPRQLIHMQPFAMEQEIPDYDMDTDDERWLQAQKPRLDLNVLKFEEMMDRLEKSSGQTVTTLAEAKALLKEDDELTIAVYDYWLNKRLNFQHPLISVVRTEHRSGIAANNPYLAFRRLTEKMQTRKNRKNDEFSYEKMLKLRRDLLRAVTLLELVKRREKCKREFLHLTVEVFEKRFQARDFSGAIVAEAAASKPPLAPRPAFTPIFHNHNQSWVDVAIAQTQSTNHHHHFKTTIKDEIIGRREKRQYKKRKHKSRTVEGLSSDEESSLGGPPRESTPEPEQKDEGPFTFRRKKLVNYHHGGPLGNCSPRLEKGVEDQYSMVSLSNDKTVGFVRKRVGRGGRVIIDRSETIDDFWRRLDYTIIEPKMDRAVTVDESKTSEKLGMENFMLNSDWAHKQRSNYDSGYSDSISDIKSEKESLPELTNDLITGDSYIDDKRVELLLPCRRDLYHFRPKPPPPCYEPQCHLLEPDLSFTKPFQIELQCLGPLRNILASHSRFRTDDLDLETSWLDKGPQGPIFEDYVYEEQNKKKVDSFKPTQVTLFDASGEIPQPEDDELMVVKEEEDTSEEEEVETSEEEETEIEELLSEDGHVRVCRIANGLISKLGFEADVHSLNHRHTRRINKYANVSLMTTAQSVAIQSANDILKLEEAQKTPQVINNIKPMEVT